MTNRIQPDIRKITRLVPAEGNLVQGQSELAINPALAQAANEIISASQNHYSPAEGVAELRQAVARKIAQFNGVEVSAEASPLELMITPGATGGLVAVAHTFLRGCSALVFEPYYPYHRRIIEAFGGKTEVMPLAAGTLQLDRDALRALCRDLCARSDFPLRAIIACTPANPTGKVFNRSELEAIADVCEEFDLLCIADEVYEHYAGDGNGSPGHVSIAALSRMAGRTVTANSFSKSWNISGWRLGYIYGQSGLIDPLNNANNVFYVCSPTPLQRALAKVLMSEPQYYAALRERFALKRSFVVSELEQAGFEIYDSGSSFYVWARIPAGFGNAMELNDLMIRRGVAAVPGSAFADSDRWDSHMRFCIAREDAVLEEAIRRIRRTISECRRPAFTSQA